MTFFWAKVDKSSECWEWTGSRNRHGYGRHYIAGREWLAHRLAFHLEIGPIPDGLEVCHHCDNPPCVRPSHLYAATHARNMADAGARGLLDGPRLNGRGLSNGAYTHPERRPSGDRNGSRLHPEMVRRGENANGVRLNDSIVREARRLLAMGKTHREVASRYGVARETMSRLARGETWRHVQ